MLRFFLILLAMSACSYSASAESFALRCIDRTNDMPYFLTFDADTGKVAFKGTGSSFLPGHITASEPGRTAFTLSRGNNPPDFDLVWDEASATLTWVGIPNNPERRTVESTCTSVPPPAK
jgi:hypothetical protein